MPSFLLVLLCLVSLIIPFVAAAGDIDVLLSAEDVQDMGLKTKDGEPLKFWGDHPIFRERKAKALRNKNRFLSFLRPRVEEQRGLNVYLGNDGFTWRISRPIFTDIDAVAFPRAFYTRSLDKMLEYAPDYAQFKTESQTFTSVSFSTYFLNSGLRHPHWGVRIGNLEFQVSAFIMDTKNFAKKREGGIIVSKPLTEVQLTRRDRNRENAWQIDAMAASFDHFASTKVCQTRKTNAQILEITTRVSERYFRTSYNEFLWSCLAFSVMLASEICGGIGYNPAYWANIIGSFAFQTFLAPLAAVQLPLGSLMSLGRARDQRITVKRKKATEARDRAEAKKLMEMHEQAMKQFEITLNQLQKVDKSAAKST